MLELRKNQTGNHTATQRLARAGSSQAQRMKRGSGVMKRRVRAGWQELELTEKAEMKLRGAWGAAFSPPPACQAQPVPPTGQTQPGASWQRSLGDEVFRGQALRGRGWIYGPEHLQVSDRSILGFRQRQAEHSSHTLTYTQKSTLIPHQCPHNIWGDHRAGHL